MLRDILYPTKQNAFIWLSALYLLFLLGIGKATAMTIVFAYFLETLIIGVFNAVKMFLCITKGKTNESLGFILFFLIHYGFFVGVQSIFGFAIFSFGLKESPIKEPFNLLENYEAILNLEDIQLALPAFIITHIGKLISDFIQNKKYEKFTAQEIMFKPYIRIFVQQFVVIFAFFFIAFAEAGIIAAILLILFRLFVDLCFEAIKENSLVIDKLSEKLANEKASKEEVKKQLLMFTE